MDEQDYGKRKPSADAEAVVAAEAIDAAEHEGSSGGEDTEEQTEGDSGEPGPEEE